MGNFILIFLKRISHCGGGIHCHRRWKFFKVENSIGEQGLAGFQEKY